jgi:hypothetical protein
VTVVPEGAPQKIISVTLIVSQVTRFIIPRIIVGFVQMQFLARVIEYAKAPTLPMITIDCTLSLTKVKPAMSVIDTAEPVAAPEFFCHTQSVKVPPA